MEILVDKDAEKDEEENKIPYDVFEKLDLRVGRIITANDHPKADKLYVLTVDLGEPALRTIVAGLKSHYEKEDLLNKEAVFVVNLKSINLRGVESDGMILAAVGPAEKELFILKPENDLPVGSKIR